MPPCGAVWIVVDIILAVVAELRDIELCQLAMDKQKTVILISLSLVSANQGLTVRNEMLQLISRSISWLSVSIIPLGKVQMPAHNTLVALA